MILIAEINIYQKSFPQGEVKFFGVILVLMINVGSEQNGACCNLVRPVVVINIFVDTFLLVAPLTTKYHKGDWYAKISFNNSIVILNQIRPIDSERLRNYIGMITDQELKYIIDRYIDLIKYS